MKKFAIASLFCLTFAAMLRAQEPQQPPVQPPNVGVRHFVIRNLENWQKHVPVAPVTIHIAPKLVIAEGTNRGCSVPLLEARADTADPGITHKAGPVTHGDTIPESHLPAPPCPKP